MSNRKVIVSSGDSARTTFFDTPCGFSLTLVKDFRGNLGIHVKIGSDVVNFTNSDYKLSREGARLLSYEIERIYGDTESDFRANSE